MKFIARESCTNSLAHELQDTQDPNPLIRSLAVRTMGCIRVDKITEYLCDPLQRCLKVRRQDYRCHMALLCTGECPELW